MSAESLAAAVASHRAGRLDQAERLYRDIVLTHPEHAEAHRWLGMLLHQRGSDTEARDVLDRAVVLAPRSPGTHVALAIVLRALGEPTRAERSCRCALELDSDCVPAIYQLGLQCTDCGDLEGALGHYQRAAELSPELAEAHHSLGVAFSRLGRDDDAIDSYRRAIAIDPSYRAAIGNLANALRRRQAYDEALPLYRRLLELYPESSLAAHMTAALSGARSSGCPPEFVARLFDECADDFDAHLVDRLGYRTPERLSALVLASVPASERPFCRALDLGCGTGLVGREIRLDCRTLIGVDLSARMVLHAERTGLYDALVVADVVDYLDCAEERDWDLAIAADALPYVGDLAPWLRAIARTTAPTVWFAFSVEVPTKTTDDYLLAPSGRFAHDARYVRRVATNHGFEVRESTRTVLRREGDSDVEGDLWLLRYRSR